MRKNYLVISLLVIGAAVAAVLLLSPTPRQGPQIPEGVLEKPRPLTAFKLERDNSPLDQSALKGKWTFMFFGYTHCPDVCPTTLAELNGTYGMLAGDPGVLDDTQFVFVSVDPERDTPQSLASYVSYFNEAFIGATGTPDELSALTRQLDIMYSRGEASESGYVVNHSSAVLLIDPQVRYYARFKAPHYAENVRSRFLAIRHYYEGTP